MSRWRYLYAVKIEGELYDHFHVSTALVWIWPLLQAINSVRKMQVSSTYGTMRNP